MTPPSPSVAKGSTQQFAATGTFSDHSTQNLTTQVTWASGTPATATISNASGSQGLATTAATGTTSITATLGSVTSPGVTLTVTSATLVSIAVTPSAPSIAKGTTQQFAATGTFSDNSTQDLTTQVTWTSGTLATATISSTSGSQGLASALAAGTASITAALGSVTSPGVTLTVTGATLVSIAVTPSAPSIAKGTTQQFVATGTYTDTTTQPLTTQVTWTSGTPATATISNTSGAQGLASALAAGTTSITATLGSVTSPGVTLTVTAATLVSIAVTPAAPSIALGLTQQFVATGTYTDTSTQPLTSSVTWTSGIPATATISNASGSQGLATSVATGTTSITATLGSVTSPGVTLTVTPALVSIAVTPTTPWIDGIGVTLQFVATGTYSDTSTQNLTTSVTWTSGTTAAATISNASGSQGLATSVAAGTTSITASLGSVTSPAVSLTVTPTVPSSGLIAWYQLDEGSGTTIYDSSGNGNNCTVIGGSWVTGEFDLGFSGQFYTNANLPSVTGFSISVWTERTGAGNAYPRVFNWGGGIAPSGNDLFDIADYNHDGTVGLYSSQMGFGWNQTSVPFASSAYQNLTVTVSGETVTVYLNGTQGYTYTAGTSISLPAAIGYFETRYNGSPETWVGALDQIRLYNRALTAAEVSELAAE